MDSLHFKRLERFVIIMYDMSSPHTSVNTVRMELFCQKSLPMAKLPPTQDALLQHSKRAIYQAGIWSTSDKSQQVIPPAEGFGWTKSFGVLVPLWITLPEASKVCRELIRCSCSGKCSRCKCSKANLQCTPLCKCKCTK